MKTLLLSALLVSGGAGWFAHAGARAEAPDDLQGTVSAEACPTMRDCRPEVECLPDGTCRITCRDEQGAEVCTAVVECPEPSGCETPCARPCSR